MARRSPASAVCGVDAKEAGKAEVKVPHLSQAAGVEMDIADG